MAHCKPVTVTHDDYVIDETLTLLRARGERKRALLFGEVISRWSRNNTPNHCCGFALAWETFQQFDDKGWSFTDCTSKVVMEQLGIPVAFAFDHHFHQFGTIQVVP